MTTHWEIWPNVISGTTAGLISGSLISLTLWSINHYSKPKFEYFDIGPGLGHFFYNRHIPIVIGGSFLICHGPTMFRRGPRGGSGGFYMGPMHDEVFSNGTAQRGENYSLVGETMVISYRLAPIRCWWSSRARHNATFLEKDPTEITTQIHSSTKNEKSKRRNTKSWKSVQITIKPSSTITSRRH